MFYKEMKLERSSRRKTSKIPSVTKSKSLTQSLQCQSSVASKLLYSLCLICDLLFEKSVQKDWKGPSRHLPQRSPTLGHIWYSPPLDFFFLTRLGVQLVIVLIPVLQFISTILSPFGIPTIVNCLCVYQVMESLFPDHTQISSSGLGGLGHEREHIMIYRFSS